MTREEIIVATEIAFEKLMSPTRGLSTELMEEPMSEDEPSFKELAAQLTFWDEITLRALESANSAGEFEWVPYRNEIEWNERAAERSRMSTVKRVMSEFRLTHSTLTEALRLVPVEKLQKNGELPAWLVDNVSGRYEQWTPRVTAWAERMRREGRALPPLPILGGA